MKKIFLIPAFFVIFFLVAPLPAQVGRISGEVTDPEGKPLKDVLIRIEGLEVRRNYKVKTNKDGKYVHAGVSIQGTYRVIAEKEGYQTDYVEGVKPSFGSDRNPTNFTLKPGKSGPLAFELTDEQIEKLKREKAEADKRREMMAEVQAAFNEGVQYYNTGNYEQALTTFQGALDKDPEQPALWAYVGETYDQLKRYDEAIEAYQKAIALRPNDAAYMQNLGNVYASKGDTDKAREYYEKSASMSAPTDAGAAAATYYNLGVTYINNGQTKEAAEALTKAVEVDDTYAEAHYQLGITLLGLNDMAGSVKHLKRYVELTPNGPNAETAKALIEQLGQ